MTDETATDGRDLERLALSIVETCMRNTGLEDLHSEIFPSSMIGDYSDVKVVSPFGEIPWTGLSRISNEEMKVLMIEVVDRVFTYLSYPEEVARPLGGAARWNRPRLNADLMKTVQRPLQLAAPVPEPAPQNPKSI